MANPDDIVISGIGGKFPESDNVLELQEKLFAKQDFVTNEMRWTTDTVGVGKIRNIDKFDASPFKMHSKLVRSCDPTTTQTLERAFESIIDAGMNPFEMSGRNIGVISASMISDSENTRAGSSYEASGFTIMGHNRSMVANRISYTFNFTGPSYSIHTSWAGGVSALEQGIDLISKGFCEAAIVTTASLIFYRATATEYAEMDLLSPGSRCRSFDADANGTCRSEGVVSFFLQKASAAKRNYATLVSAHSTCLGLRSSSLIHYDDRLRQCLRGWFESNNIDLEKIAYLEADGSGVKAFDTFELNALASVIFEKRKEPLAIGSVKSNVGNTEASSSFLGITKSIIAMETGMIPPNIHYSKPNPDIPALVNGMFKPVTETQELKGDLIAINSMSLGGSFGHVVMRRNSKEKKKLAPELLSDKLPRLILMSARNENGAKINSEKVQSMPLDLEYTSLVNDVFRCNIPGHIWKSFVIIPTTEVKHNIANTDNEKQPLWYVFSGMGSQWAGMGRDLLQIPVFSTAVAKCDVVLRPLGVNIWDLLTTNDSSIYNNILNCFVGIATVQIGLVDILRALGLEPDGMVGHSVGELGCAYADGCFTAEEMVLAAYARGRASLESDVIQGMMAAVGLGYKDMLKRDVPPSIDIACRNASDSCTLSGPTEDVVNYVKDLQKENIFAKAVSAGNIAYHSRYIQPIAPKLQEYLSELIKDPKPRSAKWVSSSVPESNWSSSAAQFSSAEYHTNNLLSPVLFEEASRFIPENAIVVEIAPHGLLQAILRRSLSPKSVNISLTNRQAKNSVSHLLNALGTLYLNNINLNVNALYPPIEYPVSRGTPYLAPLITWDHHENWFGEFENVLQLMTQHSSEREQGLDEKQVDYEQWTKHCIDDKIVLPPSQVLIYVWKVYLESFALDFEKESVTVEDLIMSKQVVVQPYSQKLTMTLRRGTNNFGVLLNEKDVMGETFLTGKLKTIPKPNIELPTEFRNEDDVDGLKVLKEEILSVLSYFGYQLGKEFQTFKHIVLNNKGFTANVEWTGNMVTFLDAIFKLLIFRKMGEEQRFLYPSSLRVLTVDSQIFHELDKGAEVEVMYDSKVNILLCKGLLLEGLILSPDPSIQNVDPIMHWKKRGFLPFNSKNLKLEDFLSVSVQLVADQELNSWKHKLVSISALEIRSDNGNKAVLKFRKNLRDAFNSSPHIVGKIQELGYTQAKDKLVFKPGESYLLIGDLKVLQMLMESHKHTADCNVFLLAHATGPQPSSNGSNLLRPVFSYPVDEYDQLVLLRKRNETKHLRVLEVDQENWFSDLGKLFNGKDNGQPVALVSRKFKPEELLPSLAKHKYAHRLRCIFLDPSSPKFSVSSPFYHNQLSLGLSINVWAHNDWGSYFTMSLDLKSLQFSNMKKSVITSSDSTLDVNIVALNTTNYNFQPTKPTEEEDIKYVDYCGTKESGKRFMGFSTFDSITNSITPDSLLSWHVPQHWSMEEAATVPSAFSLAYYSILVKAQATAGKRVLVQIGSSPVGQACIAVCLQVGCNIFVTVESKYQIAPLLKIFPQLKPDQILTTDHFKPTLLLMTKGEGVEVVINCLSEDVLSSIGCLSFDSSFIHMSKCDLRSRKIVGMETFIKNVNMYGCSLTNIHNANAKTKSFLQNCILEGIKRDTVKPLKRRSFSLQKFDQAVKHLQTSCCDEKTLVVIKPEDRSELPSVPFLGYHCEPDKSFVIVGSGNGLWLDVVEWLIQRGARKLLIAPDKDILNTNSCQRFDRLVDLSYIRIMMTSASRINSEANAADLIRDAESLGPVAGVFCVSLDESSAIPAHLDSATRQVVPQLKQFVCLLGGSASVCQSRAELGLSACLVQSETPLHKPHTILPYLSTVLVASSTFSHKFVVSDQDCVTEQEDTNLDEQGIHSFLPSNLPELECLANEVQVDPSLHEVVTKTLFHKEVRFNLLPVFVLPGTHTTRLQPFLSNLMHPAYCVTLAENQHSVERTAEILLKEVLRVQPKGPYNIIGESWSGAVAFHLAILLEAQGHQVELFLLDAAPQTAQLSLKLLCDRNMPSLEVSLLKTIFDLEEVIVKDLSELHSWEEQLERTLQVLHRRAEVRDEIWPKYEKSLTAVRNHLSAILAYKPQNHLFKGSLHYIRPKGASDVDFSGLHLCSQKTPTIYVTESESHEHLISNQNCAKIVNENILYSWNL